ncbi:MAG: LutC/YkgG family protein [Dissulfurispiraceae bacterium]
MSMQAREEILGRLKSAKKKAPAARPEKPVLAEMNLDKEQLLQRFTSELNAQSGAVYQAKDKEDAVRILSGIASAEGLKSVLATSGDIYGVDIRAFGAQNNVSVGTVQDFSDRKTFRESAFSVDAGITSADFAVAETGTLGVVFNKDQPRLVSIAPPVHIAIVPADKLYPVYEDVIDQVFKDVDKIPSQFCFITGPSSTADIQGVHFKGMHGPVKIFVIFIMGAIR